MKAFFSKVRNVLVAGFLFLLPVYVVLIIISKAWTSLSSIGTKVAAMFGMKSILGVGGSTVFSGLLLIIIWIACGLLVHFSFFATINKRAEKWLSKYIPGYDTYKAMAEEKLSSVAHIRVDTDNKGVVRLSGTAKTQADVDKAGSIASGVEGVVSVENKIRIAKAKKSQSQ